ncbi:triose-phosphate isomerase [Rubellimicrobium sp. CFH 75288]|uniref:triose-phosphate isomerase n=1 Tax=Rubellimicrobium sp. CFH 75288 TaxID=2697034 RepID=UPI001412730A|nr:triose-phosphate isomerase [Rubellimicrobium sp. CFH 75288]NAZ37852.1 triose-phosphate isomerase [Rubellimicrobium sp. CFH 75288]
MTVWVGTSWKMNKTRAEARAFAEALRAAEPGGDGRIRRFVIPPFTALAEVCAVLEGSSVLVGAQNGHWEDAGAWTGEVSMPQIRDCGAGLVEIGHSERRTHFGETDDTVALKVAAALRHGLLPLVCVGESAEDRDGGRADAVLARQAEAALRPAAEAGGEILLAYEPVWAIGTGGIPAEPAYAEDRQARLAEVARAVLGRPVPVLYGGSVTAENCAALIACPHVDGLFVGRAAWAVEGYLEILRRVAAALPRP